MLRTGATARCRPSSLVVATALLLAIALLPGAATAQASTSGTWSPTGNMLIARFGHLATLLATGQVLVTGGYESSGAGATAAEAYTPATGTWTAAGNMESARIGDTATLMPDGRVLVVGGFDPGGCGDFGCTSLASAEVFDPHTNTWTATANVPLARDGHSATLLPTGKVLVAGGEQCYFGGNCYNLASAELYDPATGTWTATGRMVKPLVGQSAVLLHSGKVLAIGIGTVELYDPASGTWSLTKALPKKWALGPATLLQDGRVLVAGGSTCPQGCHSVASAVLYDPATGTWSATGHMTVRRSGHTATLLPDGDVLVTGGCPNDVCNAVASAELYNPTTGTWSATASMSTRRIDHTATLLATGKVLVAAGVELPGPVLNTAELYTPAGG